MERGRGAEQGAGRFGREGSEADKKGSTGKGFEVVNYRRRERRKLASACVEQLPGGEISGMLQKRRS